MLNLYHQHSNVHNLEIENDIDMSMFMFDLSEVVGKY